MKTQSVEIDYLAAAIGIIGGRRDGCISKAAKRLHVSPTTVYRWLNYGLGSVSFRLIVQLAKLSNVSIDQLATRMGPWEGSWDMEEEAPPAQKPPVRKLRAA